MEPLRILRSRVKSRKYWDSETSRTGEKRERNIEILKLLGLVKRERNLRILSLLDLEVESEKSENSL